MLKAQEFVLLVMMVIWTEGLYDLSEEGISTYLISGFVHATKAHPTFLLPIFGTCEEYQWLEFFAGNAACTTFARLKGFRGCKFDIKYHVENLMRTRKTNYMDVNSDSGFLLFGSKPAYFKRAH